MTDTVPMNSTQNTQQVNGHALEGEKVTYFDMANQDGKVWTVKGLVTHTVGGKDNPYRFSFAEYVLEDEDGNTKTSDLRQRGWTFVEGR